MKNQKLKYSLIGTAAVVACLAVVVCVFYLVPNPLCRKTIGDINTPAGFSRVEVASDSYGAYLRQLPLKSIGSQVHYNKSGYLWKYFPVNAAVVDKPCVSKSEDCADATQIH